MDEIDIKGIRKRKTTQDMSDLQNLKKEKNLIKPDFSPLLIKENRIGYNSGQIYFWQVRQLEEKMAGINELLRSEADGSLSFGDYTLEKKTKLSDYEHEGDMFKVKTFKEMTRLEKNDAFVYESEPGTTVYNMKYSENGVDFSVEAAEDAQLTLDLKEETQYEVSLDGEVVGSMKTNLGGKLSFSVEMDEGKPVKVSVKQIG